jgi:hypothetical protein
MMDMRPASGLSDSRFKELFTFMLGDVAQAVCERKGETRQQQFGRSGHAVDMVLGLQPRDVLEAMLAGQIVMFHQVIVDSVHDTLRGEPGAIRRAEQKCLVAMNKAFTNNLDWLERCHLRPSEGIREATQAPPAEVIMEPAAGHPPSDAALHVSPENVVAANATPETRDDPRPRGPDVLPAYLREAVDSYRPSAETIAACRANPEAMAALEAGDPERFARAMGVDKPGVEFIAAAAAAGSPFDPGAPGPWPVGARRAVPKV